MVCGEHVGGRLYLCRAGLVPVLDLLWRLRLPHMVSRRKYLRKTVNSFFSKRHPMQLEEFTVGAKVMIPVAQNLFGVGNFPAGTTGTVVYVDLDAKETDYVAKVLLDQHIANLDYWNNELHVYRREDECAEVTEEMFSLLDSFRLTMMANNARCIGDNDCGSYRQKAAENLFFQAFRAVMGETPGFDHWRLKATTNEMINEALRLLKDSK